MFDHKDSTIRKLFSQNEILLAYGSLSCVFCLATEQDEEEEEEKANCRRTMLPELIEINLNIYLSDINIITD